LSEEQTALALSMVDDRNLTSHTYNENLADEICGELDSYAELMDTWLSAMGDRLEAIEKGKGKQ